MVRHIAAMRRWSGWRTVAASWVKRVGQVPGRVVGAHHEQRVDAGPGALQHQVGVAGLLADADDLGADVQVLVDVVGPVERQHPRHSTDASTTGASSRRAIASASSAMALRSAWGASRVQHVGQAGQRQRPGPAVGWRAGGQHLVQQAARRAGWAAARPAAGRRSRARRG